MGVERFFRRAHWDRQRMQEIESYIQIETDENIARGMPHAEAGAAARRKFGNPTRVREDIYGLNTMPVLDAVARDVRFGLRMLRRTPGFTIVTLLTLGIGLGIGLVAAVALSRFMKSLLFGVSEMDPVTYIAVPIVLTTAAVVASYLPARRATQVDPIETLRAE